MKINVMNDGVPYEGREWHLNPATVCMAERKLLGYRFCRYCRKTCSIFR